jgi:hypothetical protein
VSFVQRRELQGQQRRAARLAYGYGVDLRRCAWLDQSQTTELLMRSVDRRWTATWTALDADSLEDRDQSPSHALLEEIESLVERLMAPLPGLRLLRREHTRNAHWPLVTPLSNAAGSLHVLIVDEAKLEALNPTVRKFVIGHALGHLHCGHGPLFSAYLQSRSHPLRKLIRTTLWPISKLGSFSADRAGLLSCMSVEAALTGIEALASRDAQVPWMPPQPSKALRQSALQDFEQSRLVQRLRSSDRDADTTASEDDPATRDEANKTSGWSLARCDERLTRKLRLF